MSRFNRICPRCSDHEVMSAVFVVFRQNFEVGGGKRVRRRPPNERAG
jgi:hypothetical protein